MPSFCFNRRYFQVFVALLISLSIAAAQAATLTVNEDSSRNFYVGSNLQSYKQANHGVVSRLSLEDLRYTPDTNFCGTDSFPVSYTHLTLPTIYSV